MTPEDFVLIGEWREEAPMRGAVILPVDRQGRLYLQFRDHGAPRYPGKWGLFGGVVEPDESLAEAAAREMEEETGVVVDGADLIPYARTISSETGAQNYTFVAHLDLRPVDISVREGAVSEPLPKAISPSLTSCRLSGSSLSTGFRRGARADNAAITICWGPVFVYGAVSRGAYLCATLRDVNGAIDAQHISFSGRSGHTRHHADGGGVGAGG